MSCSGCASFSDVQPYITYQDRSTSLSDTSVFSTIEPDARGGGGQILRVDGVNTQEACLAIGQPGCTLWARVLPGNHTFIVEYRKYTDPAVTVGTVLATGFMFWKVGTAEVTIPDMKPRHVYVAQYSVENNKLTVTVKDLGEDPDHGMALGLKGVNQQFIRVKFK